YASDYLPTPRLPQAYASAPCLLVFRGRLGQEEGAVAGVRGPCPLEHDGSSPGDPGIPPGGRPLPPAFSCWWCFDRDALGRVSGPIHITAPARWDPAEYFLFLLGNPPGVEVLRCDPFVTGTDPPTL